MTPWGHRGRVRHHALFPGLLGLLFLGCTGQVSPGRGDDGEAPADDGVVGDDGEGQPVPAPPDLEFGPEFEPHLSAPRWNRLTGRQYTNIVRDVLGVDGLSADLFPAEDLGHSGYREARDLGGATLQAFVQAAETVASRVLEKRDVLPACAEVAMTRACLDAFVEVVGRRLYRRPLSADERDGLWQLYQSGETAIIGEGLRALLVALLLSPDFLFVVEPSAEPAEQPQTLALDGWQRATRLALLLWDSAPDDELWEATARGDLDTAEGMVRVAGTMMADARFKDATLSFLRQWAFADRISGAAPDVTIYGDWQSAHVDSYRRSFDHFLAAALEADTNMVDALLRSPRYWVDQTLARVTGSELAGADAEVRDLSGNRRAGILTHPGFLAANAQPLAGDPIFRGLFVRRRILCAPDLPLPENVAVELPPATEAKTNRQRYDLILKNPSCAGCHKLFNPIGYGMENFDAVGAFRETDNGEPVDASFELADYGSLDGHYDDAIALSNRLVDSPLVASCLAQHWFRYVHGRQPSILDESDFWRLLDGFREGGMTQGALVAGIAASEGFRNLFLPPAHP